jgi:hypothetical protein
LWCGMFQQLRQRIFVRTALWLAVLSLSLPMPRGQCSCGEPATAARRAARTSDQADGPHDCCRGKRDGSDAGSPTCCCCKQASPKNSAGCPAREKTQSACCRAKTALSAAHSDEGSCGDQCLCGGLGTAPPPAATADSMSHPIEGSVSAPVAALATVCCLTAASLSAEQAALVSHAASCGLCVQLCRLTI